MTDDDRFYVKSLRMQNFRCFEDVELGPFDPHFNLLVGENGAGKSSVLVALASLFGSLVPTSLGVRPTSLVSYDDARVEYKETESGWEGPNRQVPSGIFGAWSYLVHNIDVGINLDRLQPKQTPIIASPNFVFSDNDIIPISLYYGVERRFGENLIQEDVVFRSSSRRILGLSNWTAPGQTSVAIREWLKDETLVALQGKSRAYDAKASLGAVRAELQIGLLNIAIKEITREFIGIDYDGLRKDIVLVDESGRRSDYIAMSDGQRALIGLVSDIVRRIALSNGDQLGPESLLRTPGLVLIDEIDLHLHPKWQRQIVPALKKVFPKIQFFATTHSPQVIGECKPEEIVLLTPQGQKRPTGSFGRDSNWILECVMEAEGRDPKIAARLKALFDNIEDEKFDEARVKIKELRAEIGEGPDIVGAEAYLWRMERLGDEAAE